MFELTSVPGSLHRGDGIVARWPGVVLVIPAHRDHDAAAAELVRDLGMAPDRDQVVKMVHDLIVNRKGLLGAALIVETDNGLGTMAFGPTEIRINGAVALTGQDGPNTDLITDTNVGELTVQAASLQASNRTTIFKLQAGIAPAAGITLNLLEVQPPSQPAHQFDHGNDEPPSPSMPSPTPLRSTPRRITTAPAQPQHSVLDYASPSDFEASQAQASSPIDPPAPASYGASIPADNSPVYGSTGNHAVRVMVEGVVCENNHFNDPRVQHCTRCMAKIDNSSLLMHGYRPSLGYLLFDDGLAYDLDRSYVIGREPGEVANPHTDALALADDKEIMSRVHAEIRLIDWDVQVVDANSTNGSYLWSSTENRWVRLPPNQGIVLSPGAKVMLGGRSFSYEGQSHYN